ncbi:MAG: hypothetical protein JXC36_09150 [Candidatus Atribacteria bacterium]|nr:hypothetical protein [Candidatus Atribacteria bacterium]
MPFDPKEYLVEILGEPASQMRNPVNADYHCPFINSVCTKRSHLLEGPFPVCSISRWAKRGKERVNEGPVCICPNRLYQADIFTDVINNCWPGNKPVNYKVAYEVSLSSLGKIDCVLAETNSDGRIHQFISVELQTVDITGTYFPAYDAFLNSRMLEVQPKYNFNWRNVYKRYIMQLIFKGFSHHHWNTRIVAVMQDVLVDRLWSIGNFTEVPVENSNIVFLSYKMVKDANDPERYSLQLVKPIGTRHMDLMNGILYAEAPSKEAFLKKVVQRLP